jgi:hypothetical protein
LFSNWNKENITNAEDFRLLNYSFVETITDTSTIDLYAKLFTDNNCPVGSNGGSMSGSFFDTIGYRIQYIKLTTSGKIYDEAIRSQETLSPGVLQLVEKEKEQYRTWFKLSVSVGDKVYVVFIRDKEQI